MDNTFLYLEVFLYAFLLSIIFVKALIIFSRKYRLFDKNGGRKKHKGEISRLGGLGVIAAFWLGIFLSNSLVFDDVKWGLIICSIFIFVFGFFDDLKNFSWKKQFVFQIFIVLVMIFFGLEVDYIANPLGGGEFRLDSFLFMNFSVLGSLFIILWIVGLMNVVNWLDGMDGLAGGVGIIASLTIFFLSISSLVNQPPLALLAISLAGALLGFLVFNFHPAKIFMGSSGALFLGFMLSVLAIFSGGKVATLFLVLGLPILDAFWVIIKRIMNGKSPFAGDRNHLHYFLFDRYHWSERKIVLFIYLLCILMGAFALIFSGIYKFLIFVILFFIALFFYSKEFV